MREIKDSGFDWIGKAPSDWQFIKGKYIFCQRNSKGNSICLQLLSPSQKFGVVPQTLLEELTTQNVVKVKEDTDLTTFKTIHNGDFCISLRSFQGGFEYCTYEGVVSSAYQVFYPTVGICDGYYKFLFKDKSFIEKMNSYTISFRDGKNIAFSDFGDTYIPYPPIEEQKKIADYLDVKCSKIDALVADIQAQIETLEQYKRSTIAEAVTKGLESKIELKDSTLEWIGKVPVHWEIKPNKYLMKKLKQIQPIYDGEDIISLTVNGVIKRDLDNPSGKMPTSFDGYQFVYPGNLLMCLFDIDVTPRCIGLIKDFGLTSPAYSQFVLNKGVDAAYYLRNPQFAAIDLVTPCDAVREVWEYARSSEPCTRETITPLHYVMKGESFMSEKTTSYEQMMFADYPDIVGICDLQKMLGIGRKAALELAKHPQIHGVIVGNRFRIPKINVIRYMLCDADAS